MRVDILRKIRGVMMRRRKTVLVFGGITLLFTVSLLGGLSCKKSQHWELSRFISPETCGGCHGDIYNQWKNSLHNLSHLDPLYKEVALYNLKGLTDRDEIAEAESCVKCHTPLGFFSGNPKKTSDELDKVPALAQKGIQCDFCHSATGAYKVYNNHIELDPGMGETNPGIKRGPFADSKSDYHKSAYSAFHTDSKICGVCHDVRHVEFGTKLETTYEEWERSPYNAKDPEGRITCQGCHMYQRPGIPATGSTLRPKNPGKASSDGPLREHLFTHYFVGGNSLLPSLFKDTIKGRMAEERLKNAGTVKIDGSKLKDGRLKIIVTNTGAGHNLPTGLTDVRQMWLAVIVKDGSGKTVYSSGIPDKDGYLDTGAFLYNTVFGDGKGKPVENVAKAREILKDRRIPPKESLTESIKLPEMKGGRIRVEARLLYRSAPQRLSDKVMGKGKLKLPIVVMAEDKKAFSL